MPTDPTYTPPPFDPQVEPALSLKSALPPSADLETLISRRGTTPIQPVLDTMAARHIEREDRSIPGPEGAPNLTISVWKKRGHQAGGPGFYWIHAGGMVTGDRFASMPMVMEWVDRFSGVAVSIDYRLAPENPDPAPVEDCYAGLCWMAEHAEESDTTPTSCSAAEAAAAGAWPPGPCSSPGTGAPPPSSPRC